MSVPEAPRVLGRYVIHGEIAHGGMATVHLGRMLGPAGFSRTVAIKRLHPQFAKDPEFVAMFLDEARLAVRIQHPNVAQTLDVVAEQGELFIVMEYLHGETVARLLRARTKDFPIEISVSIMAGALHGLHAAHEATNERGEPLAIVHRDISPQNLFVSRDGITRVLDFGVAKAVGRFHTTEEGKVKGKLPYMAPEQIRNEKLTPLTDIYSASVVLWELLVGERYVQAQNAGAVVERVLYGRPEPPSRRVRDLPHALDVIVLRGLARKPDQRWPSAREMALALEAAVQPALPSRVGAWVEEVVGNELKARAEYVARVESDTDSSGMERLLHEVIGEARQAPREMETAPGTASLIDAPRRRIGRIALAAGAVVVLVAVGFLLGGMFRVRPPVSSVSSASSESVTKDVASSLPPSAPEIPSASPAVSSSSRPTPAVVPPRPGQKPKPAANCNPPWTLDEAGRKKYKLECL